MNRDKQDKREQLCASILIGFAGLNMLRKTKLRLESFENCGGSEKHGSHGIVGTTEGVRGAKPA